MGPKPKLNHKDLDEVQWLHYHTPPASHSSHVLTANPRLRYTCSHSFVPTTWADYKDLWIKTIIGIECKEPVFCYWTSTVKAPLRTHEAIWFAECRSGISALASAMAASHLLWTGGKGMKQERLNWKMLLSARVFCSVDCCRGNHFPMGWRCLQHCSTNVKSGCRRDRNTRSWENNEAYHQG